jgi:hypothetical protein
MSRSWLRASVGAAASAIEFSSRTGETISGRGGLHVVNMTREVRAPHQAASSGKNEDWAMTVMTHR